MVDVSVIIVCMNRPDILFPCLDSIRAHTRLSYELLLVAYRFSAENMQSLVERYPWVDVIPSRETRGFSENNNLALKQAKGRFCFIVNDDTLMNVPVIDSLVADFSRLPSSAAAISPCIRFADGRIQTCGRTPWTAWRYAKHYLHLVDEASEADGGTHPRISGHPRPDKREGPAGFAGGRGRSEAEAIRECVPPSALFQTYTLNGACFLIRTEVFREAGWFDERFFFTPEDIALGHKLNDMGYTVWADADVPITHLAGGSVSAMEAAIKPARVRGSLIFYGEPLWLKLLIACFESLRLAKYTFLPHSARNDLMKKTAGNVLKTVFSHLSPKEIFIRFS